MVHVKKLAFSGNPNLGLMGFATDTYCLIGNGIQEAEEETLKEVLQVPIIKQNICGTNLCGVFAVGTPDVLFVPDIIFDYELDALKKKLTVVTVPTRFTALGNNIAIQNNTVFVSTEFEEKALQVIVEALDNPTVVRLEIADTDVVGSTLVLTTRGALTHMQIPQEQLEMIESHLATSIMPGSVNAGSPYVKSGIIANKNGFVIGKTSTGPEMTNADEALGFIEK